MCEPITTTALILGGLGAATAGASVITEAKAAKNQNKAITTQLQESLEQVTTQQTADLNDRARAARKEQARIKVAAGEGGLSLGSGSVEGLLMDSLTQTQLSNERTNLNADISRQSAAAEANSMYSRVSTPSVLGAGLRIASGAASGYFNGAGMAANKSSISKAAASKITGGAP